MAPNRPRNIILVVLDSLRHDGVGFSRDRRFHDRFGLPLDRRTPTLDRLAEGGTVFTRAYSTAACATAAHAALFTSRFPSEHRVETLFPTPLAPELPTLAGLLSDAGYHTIHAFDFEPHFVKSGLNRGAREVIFRNDRKVLEALSRRGEGTFLFMHFGDIHLPYLRSFDEVSASKAYREAYAELRRRYRLPGIDAGFRHAVAMARSDHAGRPRPMPRWVLDDFSTIKQAMQIEGQYFRDIFPYYQRGINAFDQGRLARFVAGLEAHGLLEDALLVVTADHGESNYSENHFEHGLDLSDGVLQVPLFVRYPGLARAGARIETPVSHLDIAPTVLDLAGVPLQPLTLRGISLREVLAGRGEVASDRGLYAENWRCQTSPGSLEPGPRRLLAQRALRTDRYKLVIQGRDLEGDDSVLSLVDPNLDLERFVSAVDHRYLGLSNQQPLSSWLKAIRAKEVVGQTDVLTDILVLARNTLSRDRYKQQHLRRLRSFLADRIQQHWRGGTMDVTSVVRDLYEAFFLDFPTEAMLQKLSALVRHHCRAVEDIMSLFEHMGPARERYQLFDLETDPFEEINLFATGLSIAQERDALAMEIMLMEAFSQGTRRRQVLADAEPSASVTDAPSLKALG
jgi:arylsulfatase A-like enzyme